MSKTHEHGLQLAPTEPPGSAAPLDDVMKELLREMKERPKKKSTNGPDHESSQAA